MTTANWTTIRQEYEQGDSLRVLAARHDMTVSKIYRRIQKEQWKRNETPFRNSGTPPPPEEKPILNPNTISLAQYILAGLVKIAQQDNLDLRDYKLLTDSLSQCHKVLAAAPPAEQPQGRYVDLSNYTDEEIRQFETLNAQAEARRDEKVTPLRRAQ